MQLDHIGIAVKDLEEARKFYGEVLGLKVSPAEELPERQLRIAMVEIGGGASIELLFPTDPQTPVGKFLAGKGPGIHHLCYRVDDVARKLEELKRQGVRLIDEKPRTGAHNTLVAFLHPAASGGVLTEIAQHL